MNMNKDIRVIVVDDHPAIRDGVQSMLEGEDKIQLVGKASDSEEALSQIEMLCPDVVLMDIKMPGVDGVELTRQVKQKYPSCNIIMLTMYNDYQTEALRAGAIGYLLKDCKREEIITTIRSTCDG
jgi:DNA-binding NarL/FixJ family response regulator